VEYSKVYLNILEIYLNYEIQERKCKGKISRESVKEETKR
jgi:hypothetical protein